MLRSDLQIDLQRLGEKVRVHVFRRTSDGKRVPQAGAVVRISDGEKIRGFPAPRAKSSGRRNIWKEQDCAPGPPRAVAAMTGNRLPD